MVGWPGMSRVCMASLAMLLWLTASSNAQDITRPDPLQPDATYTLHVTTREVVVDVIAVDAGNHAVVDLVPGDLEVSEQVGKGPKLKKAISSLRVIAPSGDPSAATTADEAPESGFHIAAIESCLDRSTIHYELAYHPGAEGWTSGYHQVAIATTRRGVKLFFRHRYYVGETTAPEKPAHKNSRQLDRELWQEACDHSAVPTSINLRAQLISTGRNDVLRYGVSLDSDSLAFVSYSDNGRQVQLDYALCNFNGAGRSINYLRAFADHVLTPVEYARAQAHGFYRLIEFPKPEKLAMTRFVARDRTTGNFGSVDVLFPGSNGPPPLDVAVIEKLSEFKRQIVDGERRARAAGSLFEFEHQNTDGGYQNNLMPAVGPIGSFGSIVPSPAALCADVYELPFNTLELPDFRSFDSIGSIYAYSLAVPNQLSYTLSIPGVTSRDAWYGLDYHGTFMILEAGNYEFQMISDDGAVLQIDDTRVIDLDGLHQVKRGVGRIALAAGEHTIHVPYFQGPPNAVALELWIKVPGKDWNLFDLRDFAAAAGEAGAKTPARTAGSAD